MKRNLFAIFSCTAGGALALLLSGASLVAQEIPSGAGAPVSAPAVPAAVAVFSEELGRATLKPNPGLTVDYAVAATQPLASRAISQKLRFSVLIDGTQAMPGPGGQTALRQGHTSYYLTINTGKFKTVAQLKVIVAEIFRKFLASNPTTGANLTLGKIGDLRFGGELHFVAENFDLLRCDYLPAVPGQVGVTLKRADVQAFLDILEASH